MPTTSMRPGCKFCQTCLHEGWGDVTEAEAGLLASAVVARFEAMAREATGDRSICWLPYTSEIMYECTGQSHDGHHWSEPVTPWPDDVDFDAILAEAREEVWASADQYLKTS